MEYSGFSREGAWSPWGGNVFQSPEWMRYLRDAGLNQNGGSGAGIPLSGGGPSNATLPASHIPGLETAAPAPLTQTGGAGVPSGTTTPGGGGGSGVSIPSWLKDPKNIAALAGLIPFLKNVLTGGDGGDNPFTSEANAAVMDELRDTMALQRGRMEQAQPVYENLVRMAMAAAPNPNYGGPAYQYNGPTFGGRADTVSGPARFAPPLSVAPRPTFGGRTNTGASSTDPAGYPSYDGSSLEPQDRERNVGPDGSGGRFRR